MDLPLLKGKKLYNALYNSQHPRHLDAKELQRQYNQRNEESRQFLIASRGARQVPPARPAPPPATYSKRYTPENWASASAATNRRIAEEKAAAALLKASAASAAGGAPSPIGVSTPRASALSPSSTSGSDPGMASPAGFSPPPPGKGGARKTHRRRGRRSTRRRRIHRRK